MKQVITLALLFLLISTFTFAQESKQASKIDAPNKIENTTVATYDFTTGSGQYYGGASGAVEVEAGVWGMIAGDANSDGVVDAVDKNSFWRVENGTTYDYSKYSDFNLDGNLDAVDKNNYWRPNNGKSTQVP